MTTAEGTTVGASNERQQTADANETQDVDATNTKLPSNEEKVESMSSDDAERLAMRYKPSWEVEYDDPKDDEARAAQPEARKAAPLEEALPALPIRSAGRNPFVWGAAAGGALLVALGISILVTSDPDQDTAEIGNEATAATVAAAPSEIEASPQPATAAVAPEPEPELEPEPEPTGPVMVATHISSTPADATLLLDGTTISNPFTGDLEVGSEHTLSAQLDGYVEHSTTFTASEEAARITPTLSPEPPVEPVEPPPAAAAAPEPVAVQASPTQSSRASARRRASRARRRARAAARAPRRSRTARQQPTSSRPRARHAQGAGFVTDNPY